MCSTRSNAFAASKNTACTDEPWVAKYEAVCFNKNEHWSVLWPALKPNWLSVVPRKGEMLDDMKCSSRWKEISSIYWRYFRKKSFQLHNCIWGKIVLLASVYFSQFQVKPPASNMRLMTWDAKLAAVAQRQADKCAFDHSHTQYSPSSFGENKFITSDRIPSECRCVNGSISNKKIISEINVRKLFVVTTLAFTCWGAEVDVLNSLCHISQGQIWEGRLGWSPSFLNLAKVTFFTMILYNSENSIRNIRSLCRPLFCHSSVVKYTAFLLQ